MEHRRGSMLVGNLPRGTLAAFYARGLAKLPIDVVASQRNSVKLKLVIQFSSNVIRKAKIERTTSRHAVSSSLLSSSMRFKTALCSLAEQRSTPNMTAFNLVQNASTWSPVSRIWRTVCTLCSRNTPRSCGWTRGSLDRAVRRAFWRFWMFLEMDSVSVWSLAVYSSSRGYRMTVPRRARGR